MEFELFGGVEYSSCAINSSFFDTYINNISNDMAVGMNMLLSRAYSKSEIVYLRVTNLNSYLVAGIEWKCGSNIRITF